MFGHWLRWQTGRQKSGYHKLLLLRCSRILKFDVYLLRYPTGSVVPKHTDKVQSGRHYRMNVIVKRAKLGGDFHCDDAIIHLRRFILFRPDLCEHHVSRIQDGSRYVISVGWVLS